MTPLHTQAKVLNSLLYIKDSEARELPAIEGRSDHWLTPHCLAVSCLPDCDGPTEITIGDAADITADRHRLFSGRLRTPSRVVAVETVKREKLLAWPVTEAVTQITVWTDGYPDTRRLVVALGGADTIEDQNEKVIAS